MICILKNGVNLYYRKEGAGKPLIMIHGNGESNEIFKEAIEVLKTYFTVYAIDLRGHGKSSPIKEYHYMDMCNDLFEFIQKNNIQNSIFYGFSDGGIIGLLLASKHTNLFDFLIVSGANLSPNGIKTNWHFLYQFIYFFHRDSKLKMMLSEPNISFRDLSQIKTKTLVLAGHNDMINKRHTTIIAQSILNSKLKILCGETHGSYMVHSDKIAYEILEFVREN
ncbi:MAG: alpha/beta fold hydrolase [Velocimicrobium sp.]